MNNYKLKMVAIIISLIFCLPLVASASSAPDGFMGMKFGQSHDSAKRLGILDNKVRTHELKYKSYSAKHDGYIDRNGERTNKEEEEWVINPRYYDIAGRRFGSCNIIHGFYNNKYLGSTIDFYIQHDYEVIGNGLIAKYGNPTNTYPIKNMFGNVIGYRYVWLWNTAIIRLEFNSANSRGKLVYGDFKLMQKKMKADQKKNSTGL